jgi:hypothetical protein
MSKIALHLKGHPVFQKIISVSQEFWRQVSQALLGILAVRCATKIHFRVQKSMTALLAKPRRVILKEFHFVAALGARHLKNGPRFPVTGVLSWAFHRVLS